MGGLLTLGILHFVCLVVSPLTGAAMLDWGVRRVGLKPIPFVEAWKVFLATTCYILLTALALNFGEYYFQLKESLQLVIVRACVFVLLYLLLVPLLCRRWERLFWAVAFTVVLANIGLTWCVLSVATDAVSKIP